MGDNTLQTDRKTVRLEDVLKGDETWRMISDPHAVEALRQEFGEFIGSDLDAIYANSYGYFGSGEQRSFRSRVCNIIVLSKPSSFFIYEKSAGSTEIRSGEGAYRLVDEFTGGRHVITKNFYYVGYERGKSFLDLPFRDLSKIDKGKVCYTNSWMHVESEYLKRHLGAAHTVFSDDRIKQEFSQVFE